MEPKKHEIKGALHRPSEVKTPNEPLTADGELPAIDDKTIFDNMKSRILSSVVTECLDSHENCTGYYTDTSEQYVIRCSCLCHGKIVQAVTTGTDNENCSFGKEKGKAISTKEETDGVETNQQHPRPLLTCFRSSMNDLIHQSQHQHCHPNEERIGFDRHIQGGSIGL